MDQPLRATEIESLFPDQTVVAFASDHLLPDAFLFDDERAFIENAIEGRRAEFATGRACARAALRELGVDAGSLPVGEGRQPVWPPGTTAAITHTRREGREFVAAVAAFDHNHTMGIGLDAEVIQPLKGGVREMLLVNDELEAVAALPQEEQETAAIRVFSAKEAFYKAQYALTNGWVGFNDMRLDSFTGTGTLVQTGELEVLQAVTTPARFEQTVSNGLVISGVVVRRAAGSPSQ